MTQIIIDRNWKLVGCIHIGETELCYECVWRKKNNCVGKKVYFNLMAKLGHIGEIDYDISSENGPENGSNL